MFNGDDPAVLDAIRIGGLPGTLLDGLVYHPDPRIRAAVAASPGTPLDALDVLSRSPAPEVRAAVAGNPIVTVDLLTALADIPIMNGPDLVTQAEAAAEVLTAVVAASAATPAVLEQVMRSIDRFDQAAAECAWSSSESEQRYGWAFSGTLAEVVRRPFVDGPMFARCFRNGHAMFSGCCEVAEAAMQRPDLSTVAPVAAAVLARSGCPVTAEWVREQAVGPDTDPVVLAGIAWNVGKVGVCEEHGPHDGYCADCEATALTEPIVSGSMLVGLAHHPSPVVRAAVESRFLGPASDALVAAVVADGPGRW